MIPATFGMPLCGNTKRNRRKEGSMNKLPLSELTIENGMRLLAKAGRRIDAAFCGRVVKRQFVIRDEIRNPPDLNDLRDGFCRANLP